jgi:hypothetical protein
LPDVGYGLADLPIMTMFLGWGAVAMVGADRLLVLWNGVVGWRGEVEGAEMHDVIYVPLIGEVWCCRG